VIAIGAREDQNAEFHRLRIAFGAAIRVWARD
jgi:hypothetical protein